MGLETIGDGLATRLKTISGLRVYAPKELKDSLSQFPCALILPGETTYKIEFSSTFSSYTFRILLLFTKQDQPSAINKMLDYIEVTGDYSVVAAIYGDSTLGGAADDCIVRRNLGIGGITWGGYVYLGTEFEVEVWA